MGKVITLHVPLSSPILLTACCRPASCKVFFLVSIDLTPLHTLPFYLFFHIGRWLGLVRDGDAASNWTCRMGSENNASNNSNTKRPATHTLAINGSYILDS